MYAIINTTDNQYRTVAILEDKETALIWREAFQSDNKCFEEFVVDDIPFIPKGTIPAKVKVYCLQMHWMDDGAIEPATPMGYLRYHEEWTFKAPTKITVRYVRPPIFHQEGGRIEITGTNENRIKEIYKDRLAKWVAGTWGGPGHDEINEQE